MSNTITGQSFVVLSEGLSKWRKGDVIAASVLRDAGCDIPRLLSLKAVREATANEAGNNHVDLVSPERHLSYEHQLAEKDQEIARLTGRVSSLEEQMSAGAHLKQLAPSTLNESALITEKDKAIQSLEGRVTALTQEAATARAEAASLRSELILARAEINSARSVAASAARAEADAAPKPAEKPAPATLAAEKPKPAKLKEAALPPVADVPGGPSRIRRVS